VTVTSSVDLQNAFPIGVSRVVFTATDDCGNTTTCLYRIEVDNPAINSCPADIAVACNPTLDGAIVSWEPPNGNDCCSSCSENTDIAGYTYLGMRGGHRYYLSKEKMDWPAARRSAEDLGGGLAIINDPAENQYLADLIPDNQTAFIGLSDLGSEGDFYWLDGSPLLFTNWVPNQPNNKDGIQHYGQFFGNGRWNDAYVTNKFQVLVEIVCADVIQVSGPMNGGKFEAGSTKVAYQIEYDDCPNADFCEFNVTVDDCPLRYCQSGGRADCFWIERIQFADLDHTSGDDNGYGDYTDIVGTLTAGQTETILLKPAFLNNHIFDVNWTVFIDYNRDGDFEDEGEHVLSKFENRVFHKKGDRPVFQTFTVLENATAGPTRMRISMKFTENIDPCGRFVSGEVQDYTINILPAANQLVAYVEAEALLQAVEKEVQIATNNSTDDSSVGGIPTKNPGDISLLQVQLYPNPVRDGLSVNLDFSGKTSNLSNTSSKLKIYNYGGQLVFEQVLTSDVQQSYLVDVRSYSNGLYFLTIEDEVEVRRMKKFTKY
ncbi:MAG: GEVED domain-containing protein, partial [Bacteroidota bacterium]